MSLGAALNTPLAHRTGLLLLAVLLGGMVGWERERQERPAGLRTHILVCVGAALMTLVDQSISNIGGRIAAQIVTGVGFLGAGTIIRENDTMGTPVRGLTTAASLWGYGRRRHCRRDGRPERPNLRQSARSSSCLRCPCSTAWKTYLTAAAAARC